MGWQTPIRYVGKAGENLLDRVLCVAGAVAFSQMPEFMQQYLQRLGGALGEARRQLNQFENVAAQSGQTLDALVRHTKAGGDAAMGRLGDVITQTGARVQELSAAEAALRSATPLTRPFAFVRHLDSQLAGDTWSVFAPAVPTTIEGALYAAVGVVVFLALYHGLLKQPTLALARRVRGGKLGARRDSAVRMGAK